MLHDLRSWKMQVSNEREPNGDSYGEIGLRDNAYPGDD